MRSTDGGGATLDFKGNLLSSERQLATTYDTTVDWSALATDTTVTALESHAASSLETEVFTETRAYDALNRPTSLITPDNSEVLPTYNEAGLLESVAVKVRGATTASNVVTGIEYDAHGRRKAIAYANGAATSYEYDEYTFRLTQAVSTRSTPSASLQDLSYTYDPVGNILAIADAAQQTLFYNNTVTSGSTLYEYDASYRLKWAKGREHAGTGGDVQRDNNDLPLRALPHENDSAAVQPYEEDYAYDLVGNILSLHHTRVGSSTGSWTRNYSYVSGTNRLASNSIPGGTSTYSYDAHGNTTSMPHLSSIAYSPFDQMIEADLGGGGTAYFTYDASGQRVRKVHEHSSSTIVEERIYLGGYELYRKHDSSGMLLERQTLHLMDGTRRVAMVETKTIEDDIAITDPEELWRFQLDNHLGSACLELDDSAAVISYEEYHPYGTSAYRAANASEVSERRYRHIGKERDEETGFYVMGVRYYAAWVGRWTTADPAGIGADGPGLYAYCRGNPVALRDPNGRDGDEIENGAAGTGGGPPPPVDDAVSEYYADQAGMAELEQSEAETSVGERFRNGVNGVLYTLMSPFVNTANAPEASYTPAKAVRSQSEVEFAINVANFAGGGRGPLLVARRLGGGLLSALGLGALIGAGESVLIAATAPEAAEKDPDYAAAAVEGAERGMFEVVVAATLEVGGALVRSLLRKGGGATISGAAGDKVPHGSVGAMTNRYSGERVPVPSPDLAADALAARLGGESRFKFAADPLQQEFDAISDRFIGQTRDASAAIGSRFRNQAKATFEAAIASGRTPYFHFQTTPHPSVLLKIREYENRYGIKAVLDFEPLP